MNVRVLVVYRSKGNGKYVANIRDGAVSEWSDKLCDAYVFTIGDAVRRCEILTNSKLFQKEEIQVPRKAFSVKARRVRKRA